MSEGKVAAVAPTSAMIWVAESIPRPGTSGSRATAVLVLTEQTGDLLIELADVLLEELQLLQRHLQESAIDGRPLPLCR